MIGKKRTLMIIFLIFAIFLISSVSASEDLDEVSSSGNSSQIDENQRISASENSQTLKQVESDDTLSAASYGYKIDLKDTYEIQATKSKKISYTIGPVTSNGAYSYDYKLAVITADGLVILDEKSGSYTTGQKTVYYTFKANQMTPGTYILFASNNADAKVMDGSMLKVSGQATITAQDFNDYYNSGHVMTAKLAEKSSGKPVMGVNVKVTFTSSKMTQTKTYVTDKNGQISITPPKDIATYTVKIESADSHITADAIQRTAVIKKAPVRVKAYNVVEYKGFKIKIKAKVTSLGKNVNEGTVKFKINGKTYKVAVKKGWAVKKLKLKKLKRYTYSAKFSSSNFITPKAAKAKATMKKRLATKIVVKNQKVYMSQTKYFTVKILTKSGKKVSGGKLKIIGRGSTDVKKGKAKLAKYGLGIKHLKRISGRSEYYKKSITKTFKLKYIPSSHKYLPVTKKVKVTSIFKCPACGKRTTHNHYAVGYYVVYKTRIVVS